MTTAHQILDACLLAEKCSAYITYVIINYVGDSASGNRVAGFVNLHSTTLMALAMRHLLGYFPNRIYGRVLETLTDLRVIVVIKTTES